MSLPEPREGAAALVTGASAGIGTEIARELARRGHDLVIVARRQELLDELAAELGKAHGVTVTALSCDLADAPGRAGLTERIVPEIDILINNAGFATGGRFQESELEKELQQVRILCEAVVGLTYAHLPGMVERRKGAILNVASTAGMQPLPYSAGYSAAKAHALTFSEALHYEVKRVGVAVTALCPGPVATEFWDAAGGDQPIESSVPRPMWVSAEDVAKAGVKALAANRRVVVPGLPMASFQRAGQFVPHGIKVPVMERLMRR